MKRGIKAIALIVALFSICTGTVSAAEYLYDDFSEGTKNMVTSTLEGASYIEESDGDFDYVSFDNPTDSAFVHKLNASKKVLAGGEILKFDWRVDEKYANNAYAINEFCLGFVGETGVKFSVNYCTTEITPEDNVWYTGLIVLNEDYSQASFYRKVKDSEEPFAFVKKNSNPSVDRTEDAGWRMYNRQSRVSVSNVQIWDDTFAKEGSFEMNGEPITKLSEVESGTLVAKTMVTCGEISESASDLGGTVLSTMKVMPLVVVYNENMRMISCMINEEGWELTVGDNTLTVEIDTNAFVDRIGNGHIGLYLWDDLEGICPLANAVKLQ